MSDSRFGDSTRNLSADMPSSASSASHKLFSTRASSLNLFQSLDEFSGTIERKYSSPYECLPKSNDVTESSFCLPRSVSEIWSQDSCSTCVSVETPVECPRSGSEFSDYGHLFLDGTCNASFTGGGISGGRRSVILLLSPLLQ